nr:hypothetical protein [Conexibacter arvalis]
MERIGGDLLVRALDERPPFAEQPEEGVTYAEKIGPEDRTLDPVRDDAATLDRVVRGLTPHVGARLPLPASDPPAFLGVAAALPLDGEEVAALAVAAPAPGALAAAGDRLLLGAAGGTVLELERVQPPGGKAMPAADYLRGRGLPGA